MKTQLATPQKAKNWMPNKATTSQNLLTVIAIVEASLFHRQINWYVPIDAVDKVYAN